MIFHFTNSNISDILIVVSFGVGLGSLEVNAIIAEYSLASNDTFYF